MTVIVLVCVPGKFWRGFSPRYDDIVKVSRGSFPRIIQIIYRKRSFLRDRSKENE